MLLFLITTIDLIVVITYTDESTAVYEFITRIIQAATYVSRQKQSEANSKSLFDRGLNEA